MSSEKKHSKNSSLAFFLGVPFCGLGHIVCGRAFRGLFLFAAFFFCLFLGSMVFVGMLAHVFPPFAWLLFWSLAFCLWVYSLADLWEMKTAPLPVLDRDHVPVASEEAAVAAPAPASAEPAPPEESPQFVEEKKWFHNAAAPAAPEEPVAEKKADFAVEEKEETAAGEKIETPVVAQETEPEEPAENSPAADAQAEESVIEDKQEEPAVEEKEDIPAVTQSPGMERVFVPISRHGAPFEHPDDLEPPESLSVEDFAVHPLRAGDEITTLPGISDPEHTALSQLTLGSAPETAAPERTGEEKAVIKDLSDTASEQDADIKEEPAIESEPRVEETDVEKEIEAPVLEEESEETVVEEKQEEPVVKEKSSEPAVTQAPQFQSLPGTPEAEEKPEDFILAEESAETAAPVVEEKEDIPAVTQSPVAQEEPGTEDKEEEPVVKEESSEPAVTQSPSILEIEMNDQSQVREFTSAVLDSDLMSDSDHGETSPRMDNPPVAEPAPPVFEEKPAAEEKPEEPVVEEKEDIPAVAQAPQVPDIVSDIIDDIIAEKQQPTESFPQELSPLPDFQSRPNPASAEKPAFTHEPKDPWPQEDNVNASVADEKTEDRLVPGFHEKEPAAEEEPETPAQPQASQVHYSDQHLHPSANPIVYEYARTLQLKGLFGAAAMEYEKILSATPDDADCLFQLGKIEFARDHREQAIDYLTRCQQVDKHGTWSQEILALLEEHKN